MNTNEIVRALRWLAKETEFVFAAEQLNNAATLIESMQAQLTEAERRERAAVEYCKSPHYGDGDYYCGIDSACQEVLDILRGPVAGEESR